MKVSFLLFDCIQFTNGDKELWRWRPCITEPR